MGVVFVMKKLSYYTYGKDNNFNFIRFIAASLVIFSHSFPLLMGIDEDPLRKLTGTSFGGLAVDIFFITSGFLICKSFLSKPGDCEILSGLSIAFAAATRLAFSLLLKFRCGIAILAIKEKNFGLVFS